MPQIWKLLADSSVVLFVVSLLLGAVARIVMSVLTKRVEEIARIVEDQARTTKLVGDRVHEDGEWLNRNDIELDRIKLQIAHTEADIEALANAPEQIDAAAKRERLEKSISDARVALAAAGKGIAAARDRTAQHKTVMENVENEIEKAARMIDQSKWLFRLVGIVADVDVIGRRAGQARR